MEIVKPSRLDALTGLRCFAAINIVLFHFSNPDWFNFQGDFRLPGFSSHPIHLALNFAPVVNAGYASVSFFILLSGFVLYLPIAQGRVLDDPTITAIAADVGRTAAQVVLRWHVQRGEIVFPKSVTRSRVEENFAIFDFELSDAQGAAITALNRDERTGPDPDTFDYVPR